jgi:arylsulfatase A-like enzyme
MNLKKYLNVIPLLFLAMISVLAFSCQKVGEDKTNDFPNVLLIYTDDVGYGDIQSYGGLIPTPNIDALAEEGLKFTNAYATAATCTPSRYSLLTGEYAWRGKGRGVAPGDAVALIAPGVETLPSVFHRAGYQTGVVGKWHLGLGEGNGPDWNGKISPGPLEIGFDYAFILPSTGDRVPTVFVENHHVRNLDPDDPISVNYQEKVGDWPTGKENPELLTTLFSHGHDNTIINGISRIGYMTGGKEALWRDEDIADELITQSKSFIEKSNGQPFFLYLATHDIHVPRIAHERFQGNTGYGPRGDVLVQLDHTVGEMVRRLKELGIYENTLIIFSSDNGPVLDDGYMDEAEEKVGNHKPSGILRGGKYSALEAGTRVPLIMHWPGKIEKGISEAMVSQVDFLASFAAFLKIDYNNSQAVDSENQWEAFLGKTSIGRKGLVQEAIQGVLTYISGDGYKYIPSNQGPPMVPWGPKIETGFSPEDQLYYLPEDIREKNNLSKSRPEILEQLKSEWELVVGKQR